jgi:hypothetical protein
VCLTCTRNVVTLLSSRHLLHTVCLTCTRNVVTLLSSRHLLHTVCLTCARNVVTLLSSRHLLHTVCLTCTRNVVTLMSDCGLLRCDSAGLVEGLPTFRSNAHVYLYSQESSVRTRAVLSKRPVQLAQQRSSTTQTSAAPL